MECSLCTEHAPSCTLLSISNKSFSNIGSPPLNIDQYMVPWSIYPSVCTASGSSKCSDHGELWFIWTVDIQVSFISFDLLSHFEL